MQYEEFFKPMSKEDIIRGLKEGGGKKKMYFVVWYKGQHQIVAPNQLRKRDDVIIEIEADIWHSFTMDMLELIGSPYNLSRKELHDALVIYQKEYEEHWHEEEWSKKVLQRIGFKS